MDVHKKRAAQIFKVNEEDVTPEMRMLAKEANFFEAYSSISLKPLYDSGWAPKELDFTEDIKGYKRRSKL